MYYEAKGLKASGSPPSDNGYQCVTAWWPIRSRRSYRFLHGFTNRIENGG
nr:MAG TPA: hypothetical protein [Caudoviricetes sp.]